MGRITDFDSIDGSIGYSASSEATQLATSNLRVKGASVIGIELAGPVAASGGNGLLRNFVIDGTNRAVAATTPRGLSFDGLAAGAGGRVALGVIYGFTDDGVFINGYPGERQWRNINLTSIDINASSVTGAAFGDKYCIHLGGNAKSAGAKLVRIHDVHCHGGGVATKALMAVNANDLAGDFSADSFATGAVDIRANAMTSDDIALTVAIGANGQAAAPVSTSYVNGGVLGLNIHVIINALTEAQSHPRDKN